MFTTDRNLDRLAAEIAVNGFADVECEVALVIDRARRLGLDGPALAVVTDPAAPEIVRARAFGIVASRIATVPPTMPAARTPALA